MDNMNNENMNNNSPSEEVAVLEPEVVEEKAKEESPDWEAEAKKFEDLYLRSLAEAENMRRRFRKEQEEFRQYASEGVIRDFLPFLDNLSRALGFVDPEEPAVKNLAEGLKMILKGCLTMLAEHGLEEVVAERGQVFDPNIHEALGDEAAPELPERVISRELSHGYSLRKRLLRPAKVMVVKNTES